VVAASVAADDEAVAEPSCGRSGLQYSQILSLLALRVTELYHCGQSAFVSSCYDSALVVVAAMIASIE
jgi:hypothetical protein